MSNLEYITNELKLEMKKYTSDSQQYNTRISILKPLNLYQDVLYLEIPKKETKFIFDQIRVPHLQKALNDINKEGPPLKVEIVAKDGENYESILNLGKVSEPSGQMVIPKVKRPRPKLEESNTFENFVEGKNNQLALAAARSVAENVANYKVSRVYNPLFIYGASGLGKTHLMQAIAHRILEERDDAYVMYLSSEKFTNELIMSIGKKERADAFRKKYRSVDILLIDDIQFLSDKEGTQEEFFHTFEDLYAAEKQIVISSDRPPRDIKKLEERLVSRFGRGIIVDVSKPDFETRVAILKKKLDELHYEMDYELIEYIAENIDTNIRDLEGALSTSIACARGNNRERANLEDVMAGVSSRVTPKKKTITIEDIQALVAERYNLTINDLKSKSRKKEIVRPRQIAMYLARDILSVSLMTIASSFNRDHTTVMHGYDKVKEEMEEDPAFYSEVTGLKEEIIG